MFFLPPPCQPRKDMVNYSPSATQKGITSAFSSCLVGKIQEKETYHVRIIARQDVEETVRKQLAAFLAIH